MGDSTFEGNSWFVTASNGYDIYTTATAPVVKAEEIFGEK